MSRHDSTVCSGQPVEQVEIESTDAGPAQPLDGGGSLFEALQAVDGALHGGIEALDAQARAVDAAVAERFRPSVR